MIQRFQLGLFGVLLALVLTQCSENKVPLEGKRLSLLEATNVLAKDPDADNLNVYLPSPVAIDSWNQMGGSKANVMPHATFAGEQKILWKESIGRGTSKHKFLLAGPVVRGGKIFTIDADGVIQARHAQTGDLLWSVKTEPQGKGKALHHSGGGVAVSHNKVFAATPYGEVIALTTESGYEIWRGTLPYPARSSPTLDEERVYVSTMNNRLLAFDAKTGINVWQHEGTAETTSLVGGASTAVSARTVIVPYSTGELFALRAENGHVLWTETLSSLRTLSSTSVLSQVKARPIIYKGMVLAVSQGDRMMAIDFRTGQRLWDKEIGGVRTPAVTDEFIFVVTNENHLACLLRDTGKVVWVKELPAPEKAKSKKKSHWAGPTMAGGFLVLSGSNGQVLFLDPENGEVKKTLELSDAIMVSPIVAEGILYFLTDTGKLIAVQ